MEYTDLGKNHMAQCSRCDKNMTESHSFTDGICICGVREPKDPIEDVSLTLNHTLNLASDITLNYVIPAAKLTGFDMDTVKVLVQMPIYEGSTLVGQETVTLKPELRGSYYYFALSGMTAVEMNDSLSAILQGVKSGQEYTSPVDSYSIASYAYAQLNKDGAMDSLKSLCAELLRYGASAQSFKGYRTNALADSAMTEAHKAYLTEEASVTFNNHNAQGTELLDPTVKWFGKALDLNTRVTLIYVIDATAYAGSSEELTLRLEYSDNNGAVQNVTLREPEPYGAIEGLYAFRFYGLLAPELRSVIKAQVFSEDGPVSNSLTYSADTYGNGKTGQLLTLCKALFAYSDKAKAYFTDIS